VSFADISPLPNLSLNSVLMRAQIGSLLNWGGTWNARLWHLISVCGTWFPPQACQCCFSRKAWISFVGENFQQLTRNHGSFVSLTLIRRGLSWRHLI